MCILAPGLLNTQLGHPGPSGTRDLAGPAVVCRSSAWRELDDPTPVVGKTPGEWMGRMWQLLTVFCSWAAQRCLSWVLSAFFG